MLRNATISRRSGTLAASAASRRASWRSASPAISNWRSTAERKTISRSKSAKVLPAVITAMAFAASRASHNRPLGSRCKNRLPRTLDARLHIRVTKRARLDEIDAAAEQCFKRLFEPEIALERPRVRRVGIELDEEIEIAPRRVEIAVRCRPENIEPPHAEAAAQVLQFLTMHCNVVDHRRLHASIEYSMA